MLKAGFTTKQLDDFGNVHFGIVAQAYGFDLPTAMYGAGAYQVLRQGGGNPGDFAKATALMGATYGGHTLPNFVARSMTRNGFTWGDNVGDSINIMKGWDYAYENHRSWWE